MKFEFLELQPKLDTTVKLSDVMDPSGSKWEYIRNGLNIRNPSFQEILMIYNFLEWIKDNGIVYDKLLILNSESVGYHSIDVIIEGQFLPDNFVSKLEEAFSFVDHKEN